MTKKNGTVAERLTSMALLGVFVAILVAGCGGGSSVPAPPSDKSAQLQQLIDNAVANNKIPGVVFTTKILNEGKWVGTSGYSDPQNNVLITKNHVFRVGSSSKTFTAMGILQLAQENVLSIDDTVEKWLPGVLPTNDLNQKIGELMTIRNLLNHTSGLANYFLADAFYGAYITAPTTQYTPQQLVDISIDADPNPTPSDEWHYTNTGYILMGMIIEAATGNSWKTEMRNRFITPLGLSSTVIPEKGQTTVSGYAKGHVDMFEASFGFIGTEGADLVEFSEADPSGAWAAGAIHSTTEDLCTWITAIAKGQVLNEKYQIEMMRVIHAKDNFYYGLGIVWDPTTGLLGHKGQIPGYDCAMYYQVVYDVPLCVCGNRTKGNAYQDVEAAVVYGALPIIFGTATP
ncbi:MAG: serine hydrolase domain-containing protein [bacterium]